MFVSRLRPITFSGDFCADDRTSCVASDELDIAAMKNSGTIAAANGIAKDAAFGPVTPPLYLSSNFAFENSNTSRNMSIPERPTPRAIFWPIRWRSLKVAAVRSLRLPVWRLSISFSASCIQVSE